MKRSILPGMILGLLLGLPLSVAASTVVPQGKENAALIPEDQLLYSLPKTETGDYILRCVDRHGPKSVLRTAYFLTPPYAIHALCRTTATNVRFTLLDGELIFNWEGNPRDLRLDLPIRPPRNGVADGNIGRDQWADIEIQVFRHSIGVFVDGRLRHVAKGNLDGIRSTVGLYTRAGSTVYVRIFGEETGGCGGIPPAGSREEAAGVAASEVPAGGIPRHPSLIRNHRFRTSSYRNPAPSGAKTRALKRIAPLPERVKGTRPCRLPEVSTR